MGWCIMQMYERDAYYNNRLIKMKLAEKLGNVHRIYIKINCIYLHIRTYFFQITHSFSHKKIYILRFISLMLFI